MLAQAGGARRGRRDIPCGSRKNSSSESERFSLSLNEGRTYRVWLCDLGDLRGEKSGLSAHPPPLPTWAVSDTAATQHDTAKPLQLSTQTFQFDRRARGARRGGSDISRGSRNAGSSGSAQFFPSVPERSASRLWLCALCDLRGEKSGLKPSRRRFLGLSLRRQRDWRDPLGRDGNHLGHGQSDQGTHHSPDCHVGRKACGHSCPQGYQRTEESG